MAGFVKLDTGILNSTIWFDPTKRMLFLTALLMAEPFEATEPIEQLHWDGAAISPTGFVVPPGWYGFVHAAGPGIIARAGLDQDRAVGALLGLGEEEAESRSKEFGGRRLVRVNGGFIVLNYFKYRDRDYTSATRSKRYRERKKGLLPSHRDVTESHRDITQAEAEANTEAEAESVPEARTATPVVVTEVIRRTYSCPEDLQALPRHLARCEEFRLAIGPILRELKAWEPEKPVGDWHKALDRFINTAIKNRSQGQPRGGAGYSPGKRIPGIKPGHRQPDCGLTGFEILGEKAPK